jgi:Clr5 domain
MSLTISAPQLGDKAVMDWEAHKTAMHDMYLVQRKSLKDIISEMTLFHNFTAT